MRILSRVGTLALLAILGTLFVSFFPASCGSFTVTHGPATAFRALDAAHKLFAAISGALLTAALLRCISFLKLHACTYVQVSDNSVLFSLRC